MAGAVTETFLHMSNRQLGFQAPFRLMINGSTLSGKSYLVKRLLANKASVFSVAFTKIIYVFPAYMEETNREYLNDLKEASPDIDICPGLENLDLDQLKYNKDHKLLILDDLMLELGGLKDFSAICTRDSHHYNLSLIFVSQQYFFKSPNCQEIRRNVSDIILFNNKTDPAALISIGHKKFKESPKLLWLAMQWLEKNEPNRPDRYIVVDCNPLSQLPQDMVVRANILPNKDGSVEP